VKGCGDPENVPPLGLVSIASYCSARGFSVGILNANLLKLTHQQIVDEVNGLETRYVGLNAFSENIDLALKISSGINHPIILGGVHATLAPEEAIKKCPSLYAVVRGEGEEPVAEILSGKTREDVPSIVFYRGHEISANPMCGFLDLGQLPLPVSDFLEATPEYFLVTSRGCPHECSFCAASVLCGRTVRFIPMNKVVDEMVMAHNKGASYYNFLDDQFLVSPDRVQEFVRSLKGSKLFGNIKWKGTARTDGILKIDDALMGELRNSGGNLISIGIESGSQRILQMVRKRTTNDMVKLAVSNLVKSGFMVKGFIMLGFPDETYEEMMETRNLVMQLGEIGMTRINVSVLRPYPGTEIYRRLLGAGYAPEDIFYYVDSGVSEAHARGFRHRLNDKVRTSRLSSGEVREIARQIIDDFNDRFGKK
jgi:anaerobic magnesium-protoporphyrin IX monomethyl ester cyclase